MKNNITVVTNEDGDIYGAIGKKGLTKLGALRAINKNLSDWDIEEDVKVHLDDLEECEFWETTGGEYDGWQWWEKPSRTKYKFDSVKSLGWGWIYRQV